MLETERLIIRPYKIEDSREMYSMFNNKEVMKFIPMGTDNKLKDTENRILKYIEHYRFFGFGKNVIIDKKNRQLIGDCGISRIENTEINELGFRIKKEYWNQGFATEAARAMIDYGFKILEFKEIHAIVEKENKKSVYILENNLEFKYAGKIFCYGVNFDLYNRK